MSGRRKKMAERAAVRAPDEVSFADAAWQLAEMRRRAVAVALDTDLNALADSLRMRRRSLKLLAAYVIQTFAPKTPDEKCTVELEPGVKLAVIAQDGVDLFARETAAECFGPFGPPTSSPQPVEKRTPHRRRNVKA